MKIYNTKTQEDYDALAEWINTKIKECEENAESIMNKNIFGRLQNRSYLEYLRGEINAYQSVLLQIRLRKMTRRPQTITENIDNVNSPSHYTQGERETIENIRDTMSSEGYQGYCVGNVVKYLSRYKFKNGLEDVRKAKSYIGFLEKELVKQEERQ